MARYGDSVFYRSPRIKEQMFPALGRRRFRGFGTEEDSRCSVNGDGASCRMLRDQAV